MKKTNSGGSRNEDSVSNNFFDEEGKNNRAFKVVSLGNSGVGKTCVWLKYIQDTFDEPQDPTVGVDFRTKEFTIDNQTIKVRIWDCSGQGSYKNIIKNYYELAQLFFLVYSVTDKDSFNSLEGWLEEVEKVNQNAKFLLVGNKIDCAEIERKVTNEDGRNFANEHNMEFFEVSAKKGTNISDGFFTSLFKKFLEEEKKKKRSSFSNIKTGNRMEEKNTNSSFCYECCSCCPCLKKSEQLV